ncbi:RadC family protein [Aquicella lusitana]|uniref:DNA replication and repair protein RadC n=1 Tax=Aquicella lusitana TaxID=254246 RepID=A0A370GMR7_9COXI|nr:DNA repair protein RadC [Aquicella lusitana]RDI44589.1 DNA replication and repair protein RadC [Aquicella lusitana]VVC72469.1 hypothetical protein AQULUS_01810 [Aquicella lusitana]
MRITDWPHEDRPREKLLAHGAEALTDAELIAIFIKTGTRGKTALDLAKEILTEYGGLKKLLRTQAALLTQKQGLGRAKYAALKAAAELGKRYLGEALSIGEVLNNSRAVQCFLADRLRDYANEVFACLYMDNHFRLLSFEELFHGTVNEAAVYPREIVRRGLAHNACKAILAHNHPSGLPRPSTADKEVTLVIRQALALVDIHLVDHIIIGHSAHFSFAEAGLL